MQTGYSNMPEPATLRQRLANTGHEWAADRLVRESVTPYTDLRGQLLRWNVPATQGEVLAYVKALAIKDDTGADPANSITPDGIVKTRKGVEIEEGQDYSAALNITNAMLFGYAFVPTAQEPTEVVIPRGAVGEVIQVHTKDEAEAVHVDGGFLPVEIDFGYYGFWLVKGEWLK